MRRWASAVVFAALLVVVACGSRSGLLVPGSSSTGGTTGSGGSGGSGGAGAAPTCFSPGEILPGRPIGAACAFDGNGALGVVAVSGAKLYGVDGTGIVTTFFQFGQAWPFELASPLVQSVESRGGYVAAAVGATPPGQTNPTQAVVELVIVDWAGSLLFHELRTVPYQSFLDVRIFGDEHGVFAFDVQRGAHSELSLVGVHGEQYGPIEDVVPVADPDAQGRIAVLREQKHYWLDPCHDTLRPVLAEQIGQYTRIDALGSKLGWVYPSQARAALETADGLSDLALPISPEVGVFRSHPSGWQLVSSASSLFTYATANVAEKASHALAIAIPADKHRFGSLGQGVPGFDSAGQELGLTSDGSVLLGLRDAAVGRMYASNDGVLWQEIGLPVGKVYTLVAIERAGAFLIAGTPMGFTQDDWAPAPSGVQRIDYQQMQLARPESGTQLVLVQATAGTGYVRTYSLSSDGGCAGTLNGGTLEVTSAVTGQQAQLMLPEFSSFYGSWSFVPGPTGSLGMN